MELSAISEMIDEWNSLVCCGKYFEMFAIVSEDKIAGYVSLYEHSKTVASIGAEVIAEERRKGAASEAISLLMRYASEKRFRIILDRARALGVNRTTR